MVLWVDLHRPRRFNSLDLHPQITEQLQKLVASGDIPHLLFYGPPGGGKKTRINAFLAELFGPAVEKPRVTQRMIETKSKKIEISSLVSPHHVEINPSDAGNSDTIVVQDVIKELATLPQLSKTFANKSSTSTTATTTTTTTTTTSTAMVDNDDDNGTTKTKKAPPTYKVVVLHEVDRLSTDAQHGLRRTMEVCTQSCRIILCTDSATKVTAPLKSRCFLIRVPSPTDIKIHEILTRILQYQQQTIPAQVLLDIVEHADGNLRRAILSLESTCLASMTTTLTVKAKLPDWELMIFAIAALIVKAQSPSQLLIVRSQLYQLLTACIPADVILHRLTLALSAQVGALAGHSIVRWAAFYDERLGNSAKSVVHLEAFVSKAMSAIIYEQELSK